MKYLKALFLATAVVTGIILVGCGGDDSSGATSSSTSSSSSGGTDAGTDAPIGAQSFPQYVKAIILSNTADNNLPDGEQSWGSLVDDETPATSSALFPASFF